MTPNRLRAPPLKDLSRQRRILLALKADSAQLCQAAQLRAESMNCSPAAITGFESIGPGPTFSLETNAACQLIILRATTAWPMKPCFLECRCRWLIFIQ